MKKEKLLYPIKFKPILKRKIWGGIKLREQLKKDTTHDDIGESWELSSVDGFVSEVINGELKGKDINSLIKEFKEDLIGKVVYENFGNEFPLLFKFIDANDDLSIQLHPNDILAKKRHNSFGKTEMWYVLKADEKAKLYAGFNQDLNKETYLKFFNEGRVLETIYVDEVKKGDAFFIDVGTIHAIGKGILIAEIQQTSNITYRIYDWDRVDSEGNGRELHTDLAIEAFDFTKKGSCLLNYDTKIGVPNKIYSCKYFTTNKLNVFKNLERNIKSIDSFVVYMCVEGKGSISIGEKKEEIKKGETLLIPALTEVINISSEKSIELLEVYIDYE